MYLIIYHCCHAYICIFWKKEKFDLRQLTDLQIQIHEIL